MKTESDIMNNASDITNQSEDILRRIQELTEEELDSLMSFARSILDGTANVNG